jgi:phage shock protein A
MTRMENQVDDRLARAQALGQLTSQDVDSRFTDLETQTAVDTDLAALKQRLGKS